MLILKIKQAECALKDGRLDEACVLLGANDLRSHRRGQDLCGRVARALVDRGRDHLAAGRLPQADGDCQKAARMAGDTAEIAQLRTAIAAAQVSRAHTEQHRAQALAAARQEIARGQLSVGQQILSEVEPTGSAAGVLASVNHQRAAVDAVVARVNDCLSADNWEAAIDHAAAAPVAAAADGRFRQLTSQISQRVSTRITHALNSGRLDLAEALLLRLERVVGGSVEAEQLRRAMDHCRVIWSGVSNGEFRRAEEAARRLSTMLPDATWIEPAIGHLRQADQALEQVRSGPLGLLDSAALRVTLPSPQQAARSPEPDRPAASGEDASTLLPPRFVLQVDGAGSFCVLRDKAVRIGPISSAPPCDLALLADANLPVISIERTDDDYFLRAPIPIAINDRPTAGTLLCSGDRIALSSRGHLAFRLPSPASTTAVLDLNGTRLSRVDVRRVILLDRELIIGPGASAHVRCDELTSPVVLMVRDGRLICQARSGMTIDGKPVGAQAPIPLASHVCAGEVSFVVTVS